MRRNLKRWAVPFTVAALCAGMAAPMHVLAAEKEVSASDDMIVLTTENVLNEVSPITVSTTQRCSIWSAPATTEENRVKYVDEGYQITVYPEVIASALGDGKTFYRTIRGAYILCRCVDGADGSGAESGNGTAVVPSVAELLADDRVVVQTERYDRGNGTWEIFEYGEDLPYDGGGKWPHSNLIRATLYRANGTVSYVRKYGVPVIDRSGPHSNLEWGITYDEAGSIHTISEYDESIRKWIKTIFYENGSINQINTSEYDASGNRIKEVIYHADGSLRMIDEYDASGEEIKETLYENGSIDVIRIFERDASGNLIKMVCHNANGSIKEVWTYEYDASGKRTKAVVYNARGSITAIYEYDALGNYHRIR